MKPRDFSLRRWFVTIFFILLAIVAYVIGYQVTDINLVKLFSSLSKSQKILSALIHPDLFTRNTTNTTLDVVFPVPCGSAQAATLPVSGPRVMPEVECANSRDFVTLQGFDLEPNTEVKLQWLLPSGDVLFSKWATTDASGTFTDQMEVRPITSTTDGVPSHIQAVTEVPFGGLIPSDALKDVVNNIIVTVFMALLATTAGTIIAAPVSFLAARNIMGRGCIGKTTYNIVRAILNVSRSFDSLVLATVFALWVGFGAFAGVLALTLVTVASLGKLFSEAVESIDPGPIEAVSATGANPVEVVRFAVVPQIIPDFISYIIYHWDINVRISTILGFVGGGGIGFYLSQRINVLEYQKAGTAIWAIILVVMAMDFLSAEIRKRYT
jgi:phosphonate transport system permease protein